MKKKKKENNFVNHCNDITAANLLIKFELDSSVGNRMDIILLL